jgi:hypothetical protein
MVSRSLSLKTPNKHLYLTDYPFLNQGFLARCSHNRKPVCLISILICCFIMWNLGGCFKSRDDPFALLAPEQPES